MLDELEGYYTLRGVTYNVENPIDRDANGVAFRLNDVVYTVYEDPSDGYRSYASNDIKKNNVANTDYMNDFEIPVIARQREFNGFMRDSDILELVSVLTGEVIFAVGTANWDDLYPYFVDYWAPHLA